MKIGLIGTIVSDTIQHYDGTKSKSLGGLLHAISALQALMDEKDFLLPVSHIGTDIYTEVINRFSADKRIRTEGLIPLAQKNNNVAIKYTSPGERIEHSLNPMPAIRFDDINGLADLDVLIVNMISGWDITDETFSKIRQSSKAVIALDLHSLTLERDRDGRRYPRSVKSFENWIKNCDVLQLNEEEFKRIGGNIDHPELFFREYCLKHRKIINLTKAAEGSVTLWRDKTDIRKSEIRPRESINVVDPTGCGDAFMSGFMIEYFKSKNILKASRQASLVASLSGTFKGLANPEALRGLYQQNLEDQ